MIKSDNYASLFSMQVEGHPDGACPEDVLQK
jgi:hypothetical protein